MNVNVVIKSFVPFVRLKNMEVRIQELSVWIAIGMQQQHRGWLLLLLLLLLRPAAAVAVVGAVVPTGERNTIP